MFAECTQTIRIKSAKNTCRTCDDAVVICEVGSELSTNYTVPLVVFIRFSHRIQFSAICRHGNLHIGLSKGHSLFIDETALSNGERQTILAVF